MPWNIETNNADCDGYAVVKEGGEVVGCHKTRLAAMRQLAALNIAEPQNNDQNREARADSYTPTSAMRDEAQQGLDWRQEFGRGGTAVGVARARDIINGDLSFDTIKRMSSYFARHLVDKDAVGFRAGEEGFPSAGRIAWALWGGDAGRAWSLAIISESKTSEKETNNMDLNELETRDGELADLGFTPRQMMQYENDEKVVELFGMYTQDSSADGAHYMAESPFVAEGLVCSSCVFYDGARSCEIVEGDIAPEGICKKWIIPDRLIVGDTVAPDMESDETSELAVRYGALEIQHRKVQGRDVEFRTVSFGNIEVRSDVEGQPMRFRGYAAVFNSPSEPLPFTETIRPGAFKRSLNAGREVRMFVNHNTDLVLGSTRSGTITVTEDQRGLLVEGELPDTTYARDLSALMQRGDVHGMSFGFSVPRGGDVWSENGAQRALTEVILHEVSVVTGFPAYPETTGATVRNIETETHIDETSASTVPVSVARRMNDLYAKKA